MTGQNIFCLDNDLFIANGIITKVAPGLKKISGKAQLKKASLPRKANFIRQTLMNGLYQFMPKKLYARTILIIVLPLILLQVVLTFVFMERHWNEVTRRLSVATVRNIASVIEVYENFEGKDKIGYLTEMAREKLELSILVLPGKNLPPEKQKPFFHVLDETLGQEIESRIGRKFWLDTIGRSDHVEIRIKLNDAVLQFLTHRNRTYASNSHIFLVWMIGTSTVLFIVALLFLRNQIRPILSLAEAAEAFGKGRKSGKKLHPRGAEEIKQAAISFIRMRNRIERHVDQRTTLLAGVSHDLRTILTRMKLELALQEGTEAEYLREDVDEMFHMLEDYMAFAKGVGTEQNRRTNVRSLLEKIRHDAKRMGKRIDLEMRDGVPVFVNLRPNAMKRAITNLVTNAVRLADTITLSACIKGPDLYIIVEDDGPGIPEQERADVFHPFHRLDHARNQNEGNAGLGLAIARDITHAHGGDITLDESSMGGLCARIKIPV